MAIAYFQHTPVGRSTQAQPYTAAAHWGYITRPQATAKVLHGNLPIGYHRNAVERWLRDMEDGLRKNGRVCDKFIIALPREMSVEQAEVLLRSYMQEISGGKAPWVATLHDWDTGNPHAHAIFVDRDEDGKRVFKTSDKGSTERLKAIWEQTTNEHMEVLGIDAQIKFGPKLAEELPTPTHAPYHDDAPLSTDISRDPLDENDEDAAFEMEPSMSDRIKTAVYWQRELNTLQGSRRRLSELEELKAEAEARHALFIKQATEKEAQALEASLRAKDAVEDYHRYVKPDGSHKGFELALFGKKLYTSPTRARAEEAQTKSGEATYKAMMESAEARAARERENMEAVILDNVEDKRKQVAHFLNAYGEPQEWDEAEERMNTERLNATADMELADIQLAFEAGEITEEEYLEALHMIGEGQLAREYEAAHEVEAF